MSQLTLVVLQIGFLALLWGLVVAVISTMRRDLFGDRAQPGRGRSAAARPASPVDWSAGPAVPPEVGGELATRTNASRLVITSGPKAGSQMPLDGDDITIGRSGESTVVIRDDYTSTRHARLGLVDGVWTVDDLGSTNGTFYAGTRVNQPTAVHLNTEIRVGATTCELRR